MLCSQYTYTSVLEITFLRAVTTDRRPVSITVQSRFAEARFTETPTLTLNPKP